MVTKSTKGTKEWADSNVNINKGCLNNCIYCYAKWMAVRFKRRDSAEEWTQVERVGRKIQKGYRKRDGRVMFPTTHDIYAQNLEDCITVLRKLLGAGNEVLITTKPRLHCVYELMKQLKEYQELIQFRFTITSINSTKLKYWEPNAPNLTERIAAVSKAYRWGFKTSISIEPFLDKNPTKLIEMIAPIATESIWLGIMNPNFMHFFDEKIPKGFEKRYDLDNLLDIIYKIYNLDPRILKKIRLKDSIKNLLGAYNFEEVVECLT